MPKLTLSQSHPKKIKLTLKRKSKHNLFGLFQPDNNQIIIFLNKHKNPHELLNTLLHEISHAKGANESQAYKYAKIHSKNYKTALNASLLLIKALLNLINKKSHTTSIPTHFFPNLPNHKSKHLWIPHTYPD